MNAEVTPERTLSPEELETEAAFSGLNRMMEVLRKVSYYRWQEQKREQATSSMPHRTEFLLRRTKYVEGTARSLPLSARDSSYRNRQTRFLLRVPYNPDEERRLVMLDTTTEGDSDRTGSIRLFLGPEPPLKGQKALDALNDAFPELLSQE